MKIAAVLRCFTRKGSCRYAVEVFTHFIRKGHEVHVYSNSWDKELEKTGLHFHKIPSIKGNFILQELSFMVFATSIMKFKKYDLVYSQPGRFFSPDVAGVHICATNGIIGQLPKEPSQRVLYMIERRNLKKCKKIIAVSEHIKMELVSNYSVPPEKVTVIHNGINTEEFRPATEKERTSAREMFGIPKEAFVILFAGKPFSRKGLEYLMRAMPFIKRKAFLFIVGNEEIEKYANLIKESRLEERLKHVKFMEKISDAYHAADMFVFPTIYEPFGLVITEAMASGLPVITSRTSGAAEIMEDGKDGLLLDDPTDANEIAAKINRLIDDSGLREELRKTELQKLGDYSWDNVAQRWLDVFEMAEKTQTF